MKALKNPAVSLILMSLIGAAAILVASYLLAEHESAQIATYIIIAIWWIPFTILTARGASK